MIIFAGAPLPNIYLRIQEECWGLMGRRPAASRACVCAGIALPGALLIQSVEPATCGSQSRDLAQAWPRPTGGRGGSKTDPGEELSSHWYLRPGERD